MGPSAPPASGYSSSRRGQQLSGYRTAAPPDSGGSYLAPLTPAGSGQSAISGATAASYTTPATTSADSGAQFTVVVSNSVGTVTSGAASLTVATAPVISGAPALPILPQATVDLTLPTQTGTVRNVPAGDAAALQNALNAATCGDTVVLVAGSTYTGNFTLSDRPCSGWIIIQSSQVSQLPPGTRVGPSKVLAMATIRSNVNGPAIQLSGRRTSLASDRPRGDHGWWG